MSRGVVVEVAAGWGGLSLGSEMAGMDVRASLEINERHVATHKANMPYCASLAGDMIGATADQIRKSAGLQKINTDAVAFSHPALSVIGGPPCQGYSRMGKGDPDDPRNQLVFEWARLVHEFGADYAVLENVPGMLDDKNRPIMDKLLNQLVQYGYNIVEPISVLDARDYGVPQARQRVVIMASRRGVRAPSYPAPTHSRDPELSDIFLHRSPTVADAFDGLPDASRYSELWDRHWVQLQTGYACSGEYGAYLAGVSNDPDDYSYHRVWDRSLLTCSQLTSHSEESVRRFMATLPGKSERVSRRHRLEANGHSLTLRAGTGAEKGSFTAVVPVHPGGKRTITVREAARLHSIPDWVQLSPVKISAYQQIGNSVPPRMAKAIMAEIRKATGIKATKPSEAFVVDHPADGQPEGLVAHLAA